MIDEFLSMAKTTLAKDQLSPGELQRFQDAAARRRKGAWKPEVVERDDGTRLKVYGDIEDRRAFIVEPAPAEAG